MASGISSDTTAVPSKAFEPIRRSDSPRSIEDRDEHLWNAYVPIDLTVSGRTRDSRDVQPQNPYALMAVRLSPRSISERDVQRANALTPTDFKSGTATDASLEHP